jgi:hypothetical protein
MPAGATTAALVGGALHALVVPSGAWAWREHGARGAFVAHLIAFK